MSGPIRRIIQERMRGQGISGERKKEYRSVDRIYLYADEKRAVLFMYSTAPERLKVTVTPVESVALRPPDKVTITHCDISQNGGNLDFDPPVRVEHDPKYEVLSIYSS